ncbi:MAG: malonyl-ACP O-methyltransferase BioC [Thioploca sp.]|nr:malonyl-ACP O-methyltransferase BioC [Thioploca sp.]
MLTPEYLDKYQLSQSFDRVASTYEQYAQLQQQIGNHLLERLEYLKIVPQTIADIGAGSGRLSRALSQRYPQAQIYGIDLSLKMVKTACRQAPRWFSRQHFACADALQLPIADNCIDLLLSNLMLQWCNDIHGIFAEFTRVLKPTGALLFSTFGPDTLKELRHSWAIADNANHVNRFVDIHELGDALLQAQLTQPVLDTDWLQLTYPDVKQLMKALKNIGAHNITAGRPRGLTGKAKFQAMLSAYEQYRRSDGNVPVTYEVIYAHAWGRGTVKSTPQTVNIPLAQLGGKRNNR